MKEIFEQIYQTNFWASPESVSGPGSTLEQTEAIRRILPGIFAGLVVRTMLDIPCGDFNWFKEVDYGSDKDPFKQHYIGADIVPEIIEENRKRYGGHTYRDFQVLDITKDRLPRVDLVLVRDLFGHFSNRDVKRALANLRRSGSTHLLATTFPDEGNAQDIKTGQWRPINMEIFFGLPEPITVFTETTFKFPDGHLSTKALGLWDLTKEAY